MSNDYYHDMTIAQAYDTEHATQAVTVDDISFYSSLATQAAKAGQGVLELGCGTGRVTIPIARAGVNIVGLDVAPEMLAVARNKAGDLANVRWVEADMASFSLDQRFGLAIIPFRSFQMLLTDAEQRACLACVHEHLLKGGRLALNVFNPELALRSVLLSTCKPGNKALDVGRQTNDCSRRAQPATALRLSRRDGGPTGPLRL